ncbi:outer membrane lipoprotein chaperone LolA [Paenalcaligenes hominis]|uniref:outer membrane lipoprotein chaperone LolA n=1 Tax=Paenalcaligenes hominis TaxID=643674 RepID=UPI0035264CBC
MKWLSKISVLALGLTASAMVYAQSATQQLQQFVQQVHSASGQFSQSTIDAQGASRPAQTGEFAFKRPGKFKWSVLKPYEQLVISDGKQLYQYDPDLNQLTQRGVDQAIGTSPAAILFGSGQLEDSFVLEDRPDEEAVQWLRATPKSNDAGFTYVDIAFKNQLPIRLVLLDSFDQRTIIDLTQVNTQAGLADSTFQFKAPSGVDVVTLP